VIFFDAIGKITTSKVFFCRSSDVVVVINLRTHFDVVIISKFFDVLFGFRRCNFHSSDLFPVVYVLIAMLYSQACVQQPTLGPEKHSHFAEGCVKKISDK
jgi:hypothetical protein